MNVRPLSRFAPLGCLAALACLGACRTQAVPGPMPALVEPLPAGDAERFRVGPTEVDVLRHGSPVQVRRAGANGYFPLRAHAKRLRLNAGASVFTGTGGRAELIWPGSPTTVVLFDDCIAVVGEPTRDEPIVTFLGLGSARLKLTERDRVRLPGGCELVAEVEPGLLAGPIKLTSPDVDTLRLENQSTALFGVAYREERLLVSPGEQLVLPILPGGSAPIRLVPPVRLDAGTFEVTARDAIEAQRLPGGIRLRAGDGNAVRGLGVGVLLEPGEEVTFLELGTPPAAAPEEEPAITRAKPGKEIGAAVDEGGGSSSPAAN